MTHQDARGKIEFEWPASCLEIDRHYLTALSVICVDQGPTIPAYVKPQKTWFARIEIEGKEDWEQIVLGEGKTLEEALADADRQAQEYLTTPHKSVGLKSW